jgi:uncharacterized protein (TIGR00369 family)
MELPEVFSSMPFAELLGIEVTAAADGHAEGRVEMREELSSVKGGRIAHGGVTYALADTVGGAAVISLTEDVNPTIDMRIDYITPATDDLSAEAEVVRLGGSVGVADVDVTDAEGHHVAVARGVYKTGGDGSDTPWEGGEFTRDEVGEQFD